MERDGPSPQFDELVPPPDPRTVYRVGGVGAGLCGVAAAVGLGLDLNGMGEPGPFSTFRLVLVATGLLAAGFALSRRATLPGAWLIGAAAAGLAWFGLPAHWDSARLVAGVMAVAAVAGAILTALPRAIRLGAVSVAIIYHFFGIFLATTWPEPTPWPTQQIGTRAYLPYLMFMYLRNAYHFYSPEPGPASLLYCLVTYDTIDPKTGKPEAEWLTVPNRNEHLKDPLALSYYRRLSLTEQVAQTIPEYITPTTFEKLDVYVRRQKVDRGDYTNYPRIPIPPDEIEPRAMQYRMPRPDVTRYLLPSYARHVLKANSRPGREAVKVKMYRIEHRIVPVSVFVPNDEFPRGLSPFHPITYKAYFVGEFYLNAKTDRGELLDPQDPMLYWLVPVMIRRPAVVTPGTRASGIDEIDDYLSQHARYNFVWPEWRRP